MKFSPAQKQSEFPFFLPKRVVYGILLFSLLGSLCPVLLHGQTTQAPLKRVQTYYGKGNRVTKQRYYVKSSNPKILEGPFEEYLANGKLSMKGSFRNNKKDNTWQYYFEKGQVKSVGNYNQGEQIGDWVYFFENGNVNRKGTLANGVKEGDWVFYYENGKPKNVGSFLNGENHGVWKYFYEDSTLKATALFKRGVGYYKEFSTAGKLKMEGLIRNGKSDSTWRYYYENDSLKASGIEKDGTKTGFWKFFHPNGKPASAGNYENNKPVGRWTYFHDNGEKSSEGDHDNEGQRQGAWKLYFPDGKLMGEGYFEKGNGDYKEYHDNGKLKLEGKVVKGQNQGRWSYYYEDGVLEGYCDYEEGEGLFKSFYQNGQLKLQGKLKNGQKTGVWHLYNQDGKLAGIYKTYYDFDLPIPTPRKLEKIADTSIIILPPKPTTKPPIILSKRRVRFYQARINELQGVIVATNPIATIAGGWPVAVEYYWQERLGYQFGVTVLRKPFFAVHKFPKPNRVYTKGIALDLRQKLYYSDKGDGSFYLGQEIRFTSLQFRAMQQVSNDSVILSREHVSGEEKRIELSFLVGNRLFRSFNQNGNWTVDFFAGIGVGARFASVPNEDVFKNLRLNSLAIPVRIGLMGGYFF